MIVASALSLSAAQAAWAADAALVVDAGPARWTAAVDSVRARRDAGVVRQRYDYSCGSAALATLLTYGLGDAVDEDSLLHSLLDGLPESELAALQKNGLSLLDLQRLAQGRGHKAQGFRIRQAQLARLSRPVIVFVKPGGYPHFAVYQGLRGDRVLLADPSLGNVRMPLYRFLDMWADAAGSGIILAVERSSGAWPQQPGSRPADGSGPPLEALSAMQLAGSATPWPAPVRGR